MSRRFAVATVAVVLTVMSVALSGPARAEAPGGEAWVRVGHFVPGMGPARIDLQPLGASGATDTLAGHAGYGDVSTYTKIPPGSYTVMVRLTSAPSGTPPMLSRSVTLEADRAWTVAVLGTSTAPRLAVLSDDLTPPRAGSARVRLLSAAPSADGVTVSAVNGPTIARDAVLGQATSYATVPAGTWTLRLSGGSADASVQAVPIASGSVYTVVALQSGSDAVKLDVVTDAAGAMAAPQGGAHTGLGGMAPGSVSARSTAGTDSDAERGAIALTALALVLGAIAVRRRLRSDR